MKINTNIFSMAAQRQLTTIARALSRTFERLASGQRVNRAGDDVSSLAVSVNLRAQAQGLVQAARNINESFGYLNAADSALGTQLDLLQRMRELAMQSANGTLSNTERGHLQSEFTALYEEFERVTSQSAFNGSNLLDGSFDDLQLQVGTQKGEQLGLRLEGTEATGVFYKNVTESTERFDTTDFTGVDSFGTPYGTQTVLQIDSDGLGDFLIAETDGGGVSTGVYYFYIGDGEGSFSLGSSLALSADAASRISYANDLNGDGSLDIVQTTGDGGLNVYLQSEPGVFQLSSSQSMLSGAVTPSFADLDSDGDLDIYSTVSGVFAQSLNNGSGSFSAVTTAMLTSGYTLFTPVDLNGDGHLDLSYHTTVSGTVVIRLSNGDGTYQNAVPHINVAGYSTTAFEDFDGDGDLDMAVGSRTSGNLTVWTNSGLGAFSSPNTIAFSESVSAWRFADMNNDEKMDIISYFDSGTANVRLGQGNGTFSSGTTVSILASASTHYEPIDINGDGILDIARMRGATGVFAYAFGDGQGNFSAASTLYAGAGSVTFTLDDVNGDGAVDLYGKGSSRTYFRFNSGNGTFVDSTSFSSNSQYQLNLIDMNGDAFLDVNLSEASGFPNNIGLITYLQQTEVVEEYSEVSVATQTEAIESLNVLSNAINEINSRRAQIGAYQNRLESALNSTLLTRENLESARSQLIEADFAEETANLVKSQVLQQAALAVLGQANTQLSTVLALLRPIR